MIHRSKLVAVCALAGLGAAALPLWSADWPTWGRDGARNMAADSAPLPESFDPGKVDDDTHEVDMKSTKNVAWAAKLGSQTYGNPVVAGGRAYVGTNNHHARDAKYVGDYGVLLALDDKTGKLLWQFVSPKLAGGQNVDWEECGVCSSPAVDGDRVYFLSNRCEVIAVDAKGLADGNQGVTDEAQYTAGPGNKPIEQGPADADILWRYDLRHELGVFPHFQTASNPLVVGDRLYVVTSNGVDWSDKHIPSPDAPVLICLDKNTGKLLGQEKLGISARTFYCNWSSPAFGEVGGKPTVLLGGGDGFLYGFDPQPAADGSLVELWRIDCNPPEYRMKEGKPLKYRDNKGPSEIIATPVVFEGKVYVGIGQDPEHGTGSGALSCIAVSYADGKAQPSIVWQNKKVERTMSTVAIRDGLLIVPELAGIVHAINLADGKAVWRHDVESNVWGGALVADGKAYVGNESGELVVLSATREKREIGRIDMGSPVFSTPIVANGALYVATGSQLYKIVKQ